MYFLFLELRGGYESACKSFNSTDLDVDCSGKAFMITGANSGIGKCIAMDIAKRGGKVHLVCRNSKTAEEAKEDIVKASGKNEVHIVIFIYYHCYKSRKNKAKLFFCSLECVYPFVGSS